MSYYLSVKETAARFDISEQKVQQLCEAGYEDLISLDNFCKILSISVATGRNWIKLKKISPQKIINKAPYFSSEYVNSIKNDLKKESNIALKSRRNKKYITGNNIYNSYVSDYSAAQKSVQMVLDLIEQYKIQVDEWIIQSIIAECAIQLLLSTTVFAYKGNCLKNYLQGSLLLDGRDFLIDDLLDDKKAALSLIDQYPELFKVVFQYEDNEDILGLLYISTKNLGTRKATGSYYTPTKIVKKLCSKLFDKNTYKEKTILDPCCGTGNFLIQLPLEISFDNIYGNDTDVFSVKIARINLSLKYNIKDKDTLYSHITAEDYLNHTFSSKFDYIIGNPPWGYEYSSDEKNRLREKYDSAVGTNIESYDVFIEQALADLRLGGVLSFVLPEALLNVKTHAPVRSILANNCSFQYLDFLGNAFDKVQCPCIIFQILYTGKHANCMGMEIQDGLRNFTLGIDRKISPDYFSFLTTDEEYTILEKIKNQTDKCYLEGNAIFALGIVTGNNKEYISNEKSADNEIILKGTDIYKYRFNQTSNYIVFKPESFQQIAPVKYYRAPEKLLYRFICNQLVFAYDNEQTLSLNSCNLVIPQIKEMSVKYILAVLNSRVAQFYFKKVFNSVKVLRSHIEQIPIPKITKEQQEEFLPFVEKLIAAHDPIEIADMYNQLDVKISHLYKLSDIEYDLLIKSMDGENLFLS